MITEKEMLKVRAEVICKLFINGEIKFESTLKELIKIGKQIEDIERMESEIDYKNSLVDCLDSTEAFQYKGKEC